MSAPAFDRLRDWLDEQPESQLGYSMGKPRVTLTIDVDVLARRLIASELITTPAPGDDPQPDEREALGRILTPYVRLGYGAYLGAANAVLAAGFHRDPEAGLREQEALAVLRLAQHLASEQLYQRCELAADLNASDRDLGCRREGIAIRWEDGFADTVCESHAERARDRGVLVVYPSRQDGTHRAAAPAEPTPGSPS